MDAGVANAINREDARIIALAFDSVDQDRAPHLYSYHPTPWYNGPMAATIMGENVATNGDRAWMLGAICSGIPGVRFDGAPADCDWDNFISHLRAEILARRDTDSSSLRAAQIPVGGMV
jgi:hypothetical protein